MKPLLIASVSAVLAAAFAPPASARTWKDRFGRTFEAEFVELQGNKAVMAFSSGRTSLMAKDDFSPEDQMEILRQIRTSVPVGLVEQKGAAPQQTQNFGRAWPRDVRLDGASACKVVLEDAKNGRYVYESPGYRFTADARITDDALRNFSVMFETTRKFAQNLPLSLVTTGREGKLDVLLFAGMETYIRSGGLPGSAGCYVPYRNIVMVPMESLGLKRGATGFSLDSKVSNLVLIHELAHQLTPAAYYAPGAMGWFSEGLAEYMASTPYSWGYFAPDAQGNAAKAYVTSTGSNGTGGRNLGTRVNGPPLRHLFLMEYSEFSGMNAGRNYALGLLVTHYFFHMEGGGKGARIRSFLEGLQKGASGEEAVKPLLGGGTYEKLEAEITNEWAKKGVFIQFGS